MEDLGFGQADDVCQTAHARAMVQRSEFATSTRERAISLPTCTEADRRQQASQPAGPGQRIQGHPRYRREDGGLARDVRRARLYRQLTVR